MEQLDFIEFSLSLCNCNYLSLYTHAHTVQEPISASACNGKALSVLHKIHAINTCGGEEV
jgi:hypothetical protein